MQCFTCRELLCSIVQFSDVQYAVLCTTARCITVHYSDWLLHVGAAVVTLNTVRVLQALGGIVNCITVLVNRNHVEPGFIGHTIFIFFINVIRITTFNYFWLFLTVLTILDHFGPNKSFLVKIFVCKKRVFFVVVKMSSLVPTRFLVKTEFFVKKHSFWVKNMNMLKTWFSWKHGFFLWKHVFDENMLFGQNMVFGENIVCFFLWKNGFWWKHNFWRKHVF